jgi:hypothetical protein
MRRQELRTAAAARGGGPRRDRNSGGRTLPGLWVPLKLGRKHDGEQPGSGTQGIVAVARHGGNGLSDDTWVPVLCVDGRIVSPLLAELRRAGIPAYCARFRRGWHLPSRRSEWCVWVGYGAYGRAQERLAEVVPALVRSLRRGTPAA